MKKEFITQLFNKFEEACYNYKGIECWSARELQTILGCTQWRNFKNVIEKSEKSCQQAGEEIKNHFAESSKIIIYKNSTGNIKTKFHINKNSRN